MENKSSLNHTLPKRLYFLMIFSTSFRSGIDGIAPFFVIHKNAAELPKIKAFLKFSSHIVSSFQSDSKILTQNADVKQSPAPTVSTIL